MTDRQTNRPKNYILCVVGHNKNKILKVMLIFYYQVSVGSINLFNCFNKKSVISVIFVKFQYKVSFITQFTYKSLPITHYPNYSLLIQVIAATNRVDILDPALLRSGRLDRKIEFPNPNEEARARILQIHSRKMNVRLVIFV